MTRSRLRLQWNQTPEGRRFRTGVSLHSHTLYSRESLDFIYRAARHARILAAAMRHGEQCYRERHGTEMDLTRAWWTPPLGPHQAWQLEANQIAQLDLDALVSLTDHDQIAAGVSLQVLYECRGAPISTEWTVPFGPTFFHLGVHNLAPDLARPSYMAMEAYRRHPREPELGAILAALAAHPETLVVFNHPLWDEKGIGREAHAQAAQDFLRRYAPFLHALELNGLRPWSENRAVIALAELAGKPLISGGDRHVLEPNAVINVSNAGTFAEFAEEIRSGWSDVLILHHYREPHGLRIVQNMFDVLTTQEEHANGWKLWSDRVFYACDDGVVRSLTDLFSQRTPAAISVFVSVMQFCGAPHVRRLLRGSLLGFQEVGL